MSVRLTHPDQRRLTDAEWYALAVWAATVVVFVGELGLGRPWQALVALVLGAAGGSAILVVARVIANRRGEKAEMDARMPQPDEPSFDDVERAKPSPHSGQYYAALQEPETADEWLAARQWVDELAGQVTAHIGHLYDEAREHVDEQVAVAAEHIREMADAATERFHAIGGAR